MKNLLVGSVFVNCSPIQRKWLEIQLHFLKATTDDFDHVVVVSQGDVSDEFKYLTKTLEPRDKTLQGSPSHEQGLNTLLEYFKERRDQYKNFLFLDSDAFPIRTQWMGTLLQKMQPPAQFGDSGMYSVSQKVKDRTFEVAAVLRCENLESRLHASVLFAKNEALDHLSFVYTTGKDLLGWPEEDIFVPVYQNERRHFAFPLLRTNKYNLHPLACGIYYDCFYHHCCGSGRPFHLRASDDYLAKIVMPMDNLNLYTEKLMEDPEEFVSKLAGWNPNRYAKLEYN